MNLETIRYFTEVARAKSFYGAAKRLEVSQQGLNKAITSLENELSAKLFERTRKGLALTSTGREFLVFAQKVTSDYSAFLDELYNPDDEQGHADDPFNIYVTHYSAQIASATQTYVDLLAQCRYFEEPFEKIVARTRTSDGSDLGFVDVHANTTIDLVTSTELAFDPVFSTRMGVACRSTSPLAKRDALRRREVADLPCAADSSRETAQLIEWLFRDRPLSNLRMNVASTRMLIRFVHASANGVALLDSFSFHLALKDAAMPTDGLSFVPLSTPESMSYVGFLYPKHVRQKPRVRHAADLLDRYLRENQADYLERCKVERA